jgi:hypothetical protein
MILPVVRALPVALALLVLALAPPAQGARRRAPIPDLHEAVTANLRETGAALTHGERRR